MIKLNEDQEKSVKAIQDFLNDPNPDNNVFTLEGIAGSGKTFSLIYAVEQYKHRKRIVGGTISHSAKVVLDKALSSAEIPCFTIAQLLELTQDIDEETGKIYFKPGIKVNNKTPLYNADIIIIDECSMLDEELHNSLIAKSPRHAKIIYLGEMVAEYKLL